MFADLVTARKLTNTMPEHIWRDMFAMLHEQTEQTHFICKVPGVVSLDLDGNRLTTARSARRIHQAVRAVAMQTTLQDERIDLATAAAAVLFDSPCRRWVADEHVGPASPCQIARPCQIAVACHQLR